MKRLTKSQYEAIAALLNERLETITSAPTPPKDYSTGLLHGRYDELCTITGKLTNLFKKTDTEFDRYKFKDLIGFK